MITCIHPSRSRPHKAHATYQNWLSKAVDKNIQWILSLDNDDRFLQSYKGQFDCEILINHNRNLVDAVNRGIPFIKGDLVVVVSDDFECPQNWDQKLTLSIPRVEGFTQMNEDGSFTSTFEHYKKAVAIYINDGYSFGRRLMTLPILSKPLIDKLGYIYYPEYTGMFADNDLYEVCEKLGVLITKDFLFQHNHYTNGKAQNDATYQRHNNKNSWQIGENLIKRRRAMNFSIDNLNNPLKLLSIQIPTITERKEQFEKLYNFILKQAEGKSVEVIYECDNKEMSIGVKRQKLLSRSHAEYFVQIDDDDMVADNFVGKVLEALKTRPDCVGYLEDITWDGKKKVACHSNRFAQWADNVQGYDFVRTPFFKDVIKVSVAQRVGVRDMRFGEDHDFAKRIKPFLRTEVFINEKMYFFTYNSLSKEQANERYGIK